MAKRRRPTEDGDDDEASDGEDDVRLDGLLLALPCGRSGSGAVTHQKKRKKRTTCKHEDGCEKFAQTGGFCIAHGGTGKKCKHEDGCEKQAKKGGFCIAHWRNLPKCTWPDGCSELATAAGLCPNHWGAVAALAAFQ